MHAWFYFCILGNHKTVEMRTDIASTRRVRFAICPVCAIRAFLQQETKDVPVFCRNCTEQGKLNVTAMRMVPINGRSEPMCEPCWGGGMGPGVKNRKPVTTTAAVIDEEFEDVETEDDPPAAPPKLEESRNDSTQPLIQRCHCGRPLRHRGICKGMTRKAMRSLKYKDPVLRAYDAAEAALDEVPINTKTFETRNEILVMLRERRDQISTAISILEKLQL